MPGSPRQQLADLLQDARTGGSFSTRRTAPPDDLTITVKGLGTIPLPVASAVAKQLRVLARPARYGNGENTLLDRNVRDTWEIPRSRVSIDKRRWAETLGPMLESIRDDLGLPETSSLKADLHSLLLYEPGQFFAAHQDSEKDDRMIGTLIVLLPSRSEGGELIVEHRGQSVTYGGSSSLLTFVAFYADTRHEVRPVTRGYRIALTYNLALAGSSAPKHASTPAMTETAATLLRKHFEQPSEARWQGDRQAGAPPDRLVFLLDHRYSEHSLKWTQLKGEDAVRTEVIRRAAEQDNCETALGLVEIQETWDCTEPAPRRRRGWWSDDDSDDNDDMDHELGELLDSTFTITSLGEKKQRFAPEVAEAELATSTPTASLVPHDTEYTGNMGNWGNTMDRWYRRAAIVVWPRSRSFAVQAKADPLAATEELRSYIVARPDDRPAYLQMASTLLRFWLEGVRQTGQRTLFRPALTLAVEVRDAEIATRLFQPFEISALAPKDAHVLVQLDAEYGRTWLDAQVANWVRCRLPFGSDPATSREAWTQTLPALCESMGANDPLDTRSLEVARLLTAHAWSWLDTEIRATESPARPSARRTRMHELAGPLLAVLRSTKVVNDPALRTSILAAVCDTEHRLRTLLLDLIEASTNLQVAELQQLGIIAIANHCAESLTEELETPERAVDDWSIVDFESGDGCQDCIDLAAFLADSSRQQFVWPLAKPRRQHIHQCVDHAELPVTHLTVRDGSPHKLVIAKTTDLFAREAGQRIGAQTSLDALRQLLRSTGPTAPERARQRLA